MTVLSTLDNNEDEATSKQQNSTLRMLMMDSDEEGEENENNATTTTATKPPRAPTTTSRRQSNLIKHKSKQQQRRRRRRRRSSAHFLRLTGRFDDDDNDEEDIHHENESPPPHQQDLGEMYKRAIRMNAENRINAGNSWGLRLIENIDKFLVDDEDNEETTPDVLSTPSAARTTTKPTNTTSEKRVNFTKASCTLDASVKIYSYRVDDVHLTSYKVLANLNRTDTTKKSNKRNNEEEEGGDIMEDDDGDMPTTTTTTRAARGGGERRNGGATAETLESNIANLNMNKLDSAYDIDPLFHKMSKTFDEGGAKGLLLVNLGVGNDGCKIIFDSKQDDDDDGEEAEEIKQEEGMIDITCLKTKLESLLNGASIDSFQIVPQLKTLREEHEKLESEGFVNDNVSKKRSRRYASTEEEEKEAEVSIHQDALERSRTSHATMAAAAQHDDDDDDGYAAPDWGGGGDDEDDFAFTDFVAADENGARYSSISFQNESVVEEAAPTRMATRSAATVVLDALCSGETLQGNDYEFFSTEALEKLTSGNDWAGAAHWKKGDALRKKKTTAAAATKKKKKKSRKTTKKKTNQAFVDLSTPPDMTDILRQPPKKKKKGAADPLQLSNAMMTKYAKTDNLLPPDAGIGIEALSTLFLRPNDVMRPNKESGGGNGKTVGFDANVTSFGGGGFDDGSYGDDNDGGGFMFADDDDDGQDFAIGELEGIRKVEKIRVGYATTAKKVDVKRLKNDLWTELENTFVSERIEQMEKKQDDDSDEETEKSTPPAAPTTAKPKPLSFKETLKDMEATQAQADVTLPFYFICLLHLANEKGLKLESSGLEDLIISQDDGAVPSFGELPETSKTSTTIAAQRKGRAKEAATYADMEEEESAGEEEELVDTDEE